MDGTTVVENLRNCGYPAPIIALTAHVLPEYKERAIKAGCNAYLGKPINFSELITKIRDLISIKS